MTKEEAKRKAQHATLCLFRSRDTAQSLDYIINDLIMVSTEEGMSLEDVKRQLELIAPAVKTMAHDCECCLKDVNELEDFIG